jgi:predicted flavoprotein YhiN
VITPEQTGIECDLAIIGAGAAGLFASIWAGRLLAETDAASPGSLSTPRRVIAFDGAKKLGAKILVAGGGRCNVTHHAVDELAYAGSSRKAIRNVLGQFGVARTVEFFAERGVTLKREDTGKLFPTTDDAHTILDALLSAADEAHVELRYPWRVGSVERTADGRFLIRRATTPMPGDADNTPSDGTGAGAGTTANADARASARAFAGGSVEPQALADAAASDVSLGSIAPPEAVIARRLILATGGMALPRSGSDGAGYAFAKALGHTITDRITPALVPLVLHESSFIRALSGLTLPTTLSVHTGAGKRLESFTNSTLCTHFGLSGPGPLDISRYYFEARAHDPNATLRINWLPTTNADDLDVAIAGAKRTPVGHFLDRRPHHLPSRLATALLAFAGIDANAPCDNLPREKRRALAGSVCAMPVPVTGSRGFTYAEVTAGGVPLSELRLDTMESRVCPGLYIIGELCDVDGRIGGFNFQWAWASGFIAGRAVAKSVRDTVGPSSNQ